MKVIIIGGGPAGMLAAISAARNGDDVTILEKMNTLGRKLLITGKGRCNITSSLDISEFIQNIPGNGKFLYSCFENFTNKDIIELLGNNGVKVKEERGNRIFPVSNKSMDVLNALINELKKLKVKIQTNSDVKNIVVKDGIAIAVEYVKNNKKITDKADKIILSTGGKSYQATGSTGDGYEIAKKLGHTVTKIVPSLVPVVANQEKSVELNNKLVYESDFTTSLNLCKSLQGLSLKNVDIKLEDTEKNKVIYQDFGEMIFTHFGVSGPTILSGSAHLLRYKNIDELFKSGKIVLKIDLKPALNEEKLDLRLLRDFEKEKNKLFKNSLDELLPQKLIEPIIKLSSINPNKQVNQVTKIERANLIRILKNLTITLTGFRPINEAIVTSGGVSIKEINPKTMESKIVSGLFFAGEIIDVDAYTGGFNLQIAYSTGYVAGMSV